MRQARRGINLGGFFILPVVRFALDVVLVLWRWRPYNRDMAVGPVFDEGRVLRFPQFRLRTLLGVVALLAVLFAVMGVIGPLASAGLVMGLVIVGLHVVGNALGTSLRDGAPSRAPEHPPVDFAEQAVQRTRSDSGISRLHQRTPLGWIIRATTLIGVGVGAWLGVIVLAELTDGSNAGLIVGSVSFAVLGGFFGFLLGSFLKTSLMAWWQAAGACEPDRHW